MVSRRDTSYSLTTKGIMNILTSSVRPFSKEHKYNSDHTYKAAPKKEVVLMGTKDYKKLLLSIQGRINTLNNTLDVLQIQDAVLTERSEGGGPNAAQAARELDETRRELIKTQSAINDVNDFFVKMNRH
jgi:hypothetical protein